MNVVRFPPGGPLRLIDFYEEHTPISEPDWEALRSPDFGFASASDLPPIVYISTPNAAADDWRRRWMRPLTQIPVDVGE